MITAETQALVNELIQGMTRSAIQTYKEGGTVDSEDLNALSNLISALHEPAPVEGSPCIGFILETPEEDDEA